MFAPISSAYYYVYIYQSEWKRPGEKLGGLEGTYLSLYISGRRFKSRTAPFLFSCVIFFHFFFLFGTMVSQPSSST